MPAGVGSGVLASFRQVGGSLGIALMGAILSSYLTASARGPPRALQFVDGLHAALLVSALIAFAAAVVALVTVRTHTSRVETPVVAEVAA